MIVTQGWKNKNIAVLGLARSGLACVQSLIAGHAHVIAWDDNSAQRTKAESLGASIQDLSTLDWTSIEGLVISPGIPHQFPKPHPIIEQAIQAKIPLISDIDLLYQSQPDCRFIGITGTNGKSTTTALVTHLLKEAGYLVQMGGNIGKAALDLDPLPPEGIYVLELSSYQLDSIKDLVLNNALLLNIKPDHLDRHGGYEGYQKAKKRIFQNVKEIKAIGVDCPETLALYQQMQTNSEGIIPFSVGDSTFPLHVIKGVLKDTHRFPNQSIDLKETPALKAEHNWQNALGAYAVLYNFNISFDAFRKGFMSFPGLVHRQEVIPTSDKIMFINDSKATNVDSCLQALKVFDTIYWILGGRAKQDDFTQTFPYASKIRKAYIYGEARSPIQQSLKSAILTESFETLQEAFEKAYQDARQALKEETPVILLSPACASFDQFQDFEERGNTFKKLVQEVTS